MLTERVLISIAVIILALALDDVDAKCVWYGKCGRNPKPGKDKHSLNCKYDGEPKPLYSRDATEILEEVCPHLFTSSEKHHDGESLCCDEGMVKEMRKSLDIYIGFFSRCPQCLYTFFRYVCDTTCSIHQSDFMVPTKTIPYFDPSDPVVPEKEGVLEVNYYMTERFAHGLYNACSNVLFPSSAQPVVQVICQNALFAVDECDTGRFFEAIGNEYVDQVPFQMNHCFAGNCKGNSMMPAAPLDAPVFPCYSKIQNVDYWEDESSCLCNDCKQACQQQPPVPVHQAPCSSIKPLYRTMQLTFRPLDYSIAERVYSGRCMLDDEETGAWSPIEDTEDEANFIQVKGVFRKAFLDSVFKVQREIMELSVEYEGRVVKLQDICFKIGDEKNPTCMIKSIFNFFQNDPRKFRDITCPVTPDEDYPIVRSYMDKLHSCLMALPTEPSCLDENGAPVFPWLALLGDGYGDLHAYVNSTTIPITIFIKREQDAGAVKAWEDVLNEYLTDYTSLIVDPSDPSAFTFNYTFTDKEHPLPTKPRSTTPWPCPGSLLGFWPLDSQYNLGDVGKNQFHGDGSMSHLSLARGPFGQEETALTPNINHNNVSLFKRRNLPQARDNSFTVSFFLSMADANKAANQSGGLFEFIGVMKGDGAKTFQIRYESATTVEVSADGQTIGRYTMLQQKGAWTFMAFTFDGITGTFSVYGRHGLVASPTFQPLLWTPNNGIRLGYASRWQQGLQQGDAISCLVVYSEALSGQEIRQIMDACRIIQGAALCGSPKLPLSALPPTTPSTATPKQGQFPFVASVRLVGTPICSASIIDQYWLITSVGCFPRKQALDRYMVYVGEHDLAINETYTREHAVAKVFRYGNKPHDIALVQVEEPIDFANYYVNDACLSIDNVYGGLLLDEAQFVVGWGENGRSSVGTSKTLPRYFPGALLNDSQCFETLGGRDSSYEPGKDVCFTSSALKDKNVPCTGDEGSPLLVQSPGDQATSRSDRLVQTGIFYKRDASCSPMKPALFVQIGAFGQWIKEKLACAVPGVVYPAKCPQ